jgi:type II secretory pathway component PulK
VNTTILFRRAAQRSARRQPRFAAQSLRFAAKRGGVVLIAVLVVVTLLLLAAYQYAEMMSAEYKAADRLVRANQARSAAASGVYYTAALLADPDSFTGTLGSNPYDNSGIFQGVAVGDSENPKSQARFSVIAPQSVDESPADASSFRYGVTDESGKINPNALMQLDPTGTVLYNALMLLPNMTDDVADAIVDWIDPDDDARTNGAENSYYMGLSPPYQCKNGPLDSIEELLYVRGVTPELLFGTDRNRNGAPDPGEGDNGDGTPGDRGWSAYLTVYSRERNVDSTGNPRINLNDTDTTTLYTNLQTAFGGDTSMADFIMAYRFLGAYTPAPVAAPAGGGAGGNSGGTMSGKTGGTTSGKAGGTTGGNGGNISGGGSGVTIPEIVNNSPTPITSTQFNMTGTPRQSIPSLFALVNAKVAITKPGSMTVATTQTRGGRGGGSSVSTVSVTPAVVTVYNSPLADQAKLTELLPILLDKCTTSKNTELPARLNANTATMAALATLPGLTDTDIQQIQSVRPAPGAAEWADPTYQTPAWLLTQAKLSAAKLQALEKYLTTQTEVYRMQVVGYFDQGLPMARVEAVIDTNGGKPRIVYWRDLSDLGKGFDFQR